MGNRGRRRQGFQRKRGLARRKNSPKICCISSIGAGKRSGTDMNFRRTLPEIRCLSLDCRRWSGTVLLFLLFGWSFFCRSLFGGLLPVGFLGRRLFHHLLGRSLPGWSLPGGCYFLGLSLRGVLLFSPRPAGGG